MSRKGLIVGVTDRAVLRYLERVDGLDVENVRDLIRHLAQDAFSAGATYAVVEGFRFMFSPEGVTTVLAPQMGHRSDKLQRRAR